MLAVVIRETELLGKTEKKENLRRVDSGLLWTPTPFSPLPPFISLPSFALSLSDLFFLPL